MIYSLNSPSHGLYIGHPCRTIQGSARYMSLMTVQALREVSVMRLRELSVIWPGKDSSIVGSYTRGLRARPTTHAVLFKLGGGVYVFDQAVLLLPCWTNNHCPRPGLNVVIKHYWPFFPPPL